MNSVWIETLNERSVCRLQEKGAKGNKWSVKWVARCQQWLEAPILLTSRPELQKWALPVEAAILFSKALRQQEWQYQPASVGYNWPKHSPLSHALSCSIMNEDCPLNTELPGCLGWVRQDSAWELGGRSQTCFFPSLLLQHASACRTCAQGSGCWLANCFWALAWHHFQIWSLCHQAPYWSTALAT